MREDNSRDEADEHGEEPDEESNTQWVNVREFLRLSQDPNYLRKYLSTVQAREDTLKDGSPVPIGDTSREQSSEGEVEADNSEGIDDEDEPDAPVQSSLSAIALRHEQAKVEDREQNLKLRRVLAHAAIAMVATQLILANIYFGIYLGHNVENPNPEIMIAWLSSTVVEVIGILLVIARSLFPIKSKTPPKKAAKKRGNRKK